MVQKRPTQASQPPREVRIVGGQWKRSKLHVLDRPGLRPTPDRVRETLFNWLGQDLTGWRCLDVFAGTGALGFEAASRGAATVCMLESDREAADMLVRSQLRLGAQAVAVHRVDAMRWLRAAPGGSFDLILLDPPFSAGLHEAALNLCRPLLDPTGYLYLEADRSWGAQDWAIRGLQLVRMGRAAAVHYHLLRPAMDPDTATKLEALDSSAPTGASP